MNNLIAEYVNNPEYRKALGLPDAVLEEYKPLAQGEYNVNYSFIHPVTGKMLVIRVNAGSQMHLSKQIEYEAHALGLLSSSLRTPRVLYVDGSMDYIDHGVLVMEYLAGRHLRYDCEAEMEDAMACLADIHGVKIDPEEVIYGEPETVPRDTTRLIAPSSSAGAILDECEAMFVTYVESELGDKDVKQRIRRLLDKAHMLAEQSVQELDSAPRCCINTELNSTNFLVDNGRVRLVDWEKPLYADPAQDLAHFLAPTTTFWKTDTILSSNEITRLINEYIRAVGGRFDTDGLAERTLTLIKITCMRGLTWCAMAWVQYKDPEKLITNESTRQKLDAYLSDEFLRTIEALFQ